MTLKQFREATKNLDENMRIAINNSGMLNTFFIDVEKVEFIQRGKETSFFENILMLVSFGVLTYNGEI